MSVCVCVLWGYMAAEYIPSPFTSSFHHLALHTHITHKALKFTIHPLAILCFFSATNRPKRVGSREELLLVSVYAWIPTLRGIVKVWLLGFGKLAGFEVSGPLRLSFPEYFGEYVLLDSYYVNLYMFGLW
jgi:hypothetical protein